MKKKSNNYLFTSESVSEGHPDKVADQISDAILDEFLARDPQSHVACETLVTTGQVIIAGEAKSEAYIDLTRTARRVIERIGYDHSELGFDFHSVSLLSALHEQSEDIDRGVDRKDGGEQGAGDQGMMFGYACDETPHYMPLTLDLSHSLLRRLQDLRHREVLTYLRPDAKSQVTVEYDGETHRPVAVRTIVLSTQHSEFVRPSKYNGLTQEQADKQMQERIKADLYEHVVKPIAEKVPHLFEGFDPKKDLLVNPTGKFVIGGPQGDTGLTGRKIIVDTYGGRGAHGGGAFSGKDPSKVDRSAAYAARHIAKNAVAAGIASEMLVQVSYAIGKAEPVNFYVNTYGTAKVDLSDGEIAEKLQKLFDLRPRAIEVALNLRQPMYEETAALGHMGRKPQVIFKHYGGKEVQVELFTWERLDKVAAIKQEFGLQ